MTSRFMEAGGVCVSADVKHCLPRLDVQKQEYERAIRKYEKALLYIDEGGFGGEEKVQVCVCASRSSLCES